MGTRATIRLVCNGVSKKWYVQWDGDTLGSMLLRDLQLLLKAFGGDYEVIKRMVANLTAVDEDSKPTKEQIKQLFQFADITVSNKSYEDWYCLLRRCQSSLVNTLTAGYYIEAGADNKQEFNWNLDFDANLFWYDDCPRFPIDQVPADWKAQCSAAIAHDDASQH